MRYAAKLLIPSRRLAVINGYLNAEQEDEFQGCLLYTSALGIGTYYVQQIQAPAGYMVNSQRVTVNVTNKNDDVKITVYNKSGNFKTTVTAHGPRTVAPNNQAKFYYTNVSNASSVTVQNFFLNIKVPTDLSLIHI